MESAEMPNPSRLVRLMAIVVTLMFLVPAPFGLFGPTKVSAGTAKITSFDGDVPTMTLDFSDSLVNDSLAIRVPKASKITSASMEVKPSNVSTPGHISLDNVIDFMDARPSGLDLNKSAGTAYIIEKQNLSDQFNDGTFDVTNWSWMNPPSAVNENLGTGYLEVTSQMNTNWTGGTQTGSFLYKNVAGNFMAITRISANPNKNQESCGLMVYSDANNWFQEVYKWRKYGNNGGNMMDFKIRNGGGQSTDSNSGFSANPLYIKITRYKDQWMIWYSNNGAVYWPQGVPFNWSLPQTIRFGFVVYDGLEAGVNFRADFDFLNLTRYLDYGNMSIGPITTKFPVTHVRMNSDLKMLENWESFDVSVRANDTGPWQSLLGDTDTPMTVPGKKFNMKVQIGGNGWTTPLLRSVTLDYYPDSWPSHCSVDIGNDGTLEWQFNSTFLSKANISTPNFAKSLEAQRSSRAQDGSGYVHIPVHVVSATPGKITFQNLFITLVSGHPPAPPVLGLPANNTWIGTPAPVFNFSSTDQDSDTLKYELQISEDNFLTLDYDFDMNKDVTGWSMTLYDPGKDARFYMNIGGALEHGTIYQWRARAFGGGWTGNWSVVRTMYVDLTPPTVSIKDGGPLTPVNREAFATMSFADAESGVVAAECGLGSLRNMTDLAPKTPVDLTTGKVHFTNLTLENSKVYYFTGRALNKAGIWSQNTSSAGFRIKMDLDPAPEVNISNPANGTVVDGTVTVSGTASDPNPTDVITIYVSIDDGPWFLALGNKILWSYEWDTKKVPDGTHYIYVKAFDGIRDGPVASRRVNVGNGRMSFVSWTPVNDPTITETENITLSVAIKDPSNIFKSYTWSIDGINVPNVNTNSYVYTTGYDDSGVRAVVVNAMGVSMSISHRWNVTVLNKNRSPHAAITYPPNKMEFGYGKTILFDGSQSNDPDKETMTYTWEFSDKTTMTGPKVNKKFSSDGTYTAKLTVKDIWNVTDTTQITVKMNPKQVDIGQQLTSFPLVLIWVILILVIVLAVVFVVVKKMRHQKEFQKKLEQKIDDSTIDDLLYYNPAPQQQGTAPATQPTAPDQGQYPPTQQMPPPGNQPPPPPPA